MPDPCRRDARRSGRETLPRLGVGSHRAGTSERPGPRELRDSGRSPRVSGEGSPRPGYGPRSRSPGRLSPRSRWRASPGPARALQGVLDQHRDLGVAGPSLPGKTLPARRCHRRVVHRHEGGATAPSGRRARSAMRFVHSCGAEFHPVVALRACGQVVRCDEVAPLAEETDSGRRPGRDDGGSATLAVGAVAVTVAARTRGPRRSGGHGEARRRVPGVRTNLTPRDCGVSTTHAWGIQCAGLTSPDRR